MKGILKGIQRQNPEIRPRPVPIRQAHPSG